MPLFPGTLRLERGTCVSTPATSKATVHQQTVTTCVSHRITLVHYNCNREEIKVKHLLFFFAYWEILHAFLSSADEKKFRNTKQFGSRSRHSVMPDLCLLLFFTSQSTVFQLCWDGSSSVEPVKCLAQGHNAASPVRLKPVTPQSRVKHSTIEPLCSSSSLIWFQTVCKDYQQTTLDVADR